MRSYSPQCTRPVMAALLALVLAVVASGDAGAATTSVDVELSAEDVRLVASGGATRLVVDPATDLAGDLLLLTDPGQPALPFVVVRILLPEGHEFVDFDATSGPATLLSSAFAPPLATALRDPETEPRLAQPRLVDPDITGPFPPTAARYMGTGYLHGHALASFAVFPFQVEGTRLTLRDRITLTARSRPRRDPGVVASPQRMTRERAAEIREQISAMVANPPAVQGYRSPAVDRPTGRFEPTAAPSLEGSPVEYLIITIDELAGAYQRLADWKTAKGVPTVVRTAEWIHANSRRGVDLQETIRLFIRDAYEKWGVKWVLLGGDTPEIPARYAFNTYYYGGRYLPVDLYYACLDGSWNEDHDDVWGEPPLSGAGDNADLMAEVYLGRLTTSSTSDVDVMIDKIINYATPVDPSYTDKLMFLAEVLFPYPWEPGMNIDVNGADTAEWVLTRPGFSTMDVVRAYETEGLYPGSIHESREQAIDSLNAGFDIVFHIGHGFRFNMHVGDTNVLIADADTLSNQDRFSNFYLLNCTAVAFDYDCLGEHFLENPAGGAVSVVGACESAFPDASAWYMDEYANLVFDQHVTHIGEAFARSRLPRTPYAEIADNPDRWTHFIYTLLADPEMSLWTGPVDTLEVNHVASVGMGTNSIQVDVTAGGLPADSVLVCLWKDTDDYQYGLTDVGGSITFDFACESPGSLSVVATGHNHGRYQGWISVGQENGAYVSMAGIEVVDTTNASQTQGNGDGVLDAGETVEIYPVVLNSGLTPSNWTLLSLQTNHPMVTILDDMAAVAPVPAGDTLLASDPWRVQLADSTADETAVEFAVGVSETGGGSWSDTFTRLIHAPELEFVTIRRDDSPPHGNGNGTIESGEDFLLYFSIKNYGSGVAGGLTARIDDFAGGFVVVDSSDTYGDIGPMAEAENSSGFLLSETNTFATNYMEVVVTDVYGRALVDTVEFREPVAPTNLRFDTSLGEDKMYLWWDASFSSDVDRYRVYRSTTPGGPYLPATVDLVEHSIFTDVGLAPSTKYYYVVAAVDSSGNESGPSAEGSATTAPPMLGGWPNLLPDESSNSPVVGDIDGDGDPEIIVGNDVLYAWHHDGREVIDGDNDLLTWGVFSAQGQDYVGPAALARLDNNPGLEIVAATLTSKQVFCFDHTGAVLPGWPKSTTYEVRAGVVVGDLDGDNDFEIIAIDQDAIMYAWHHTGQEVRDGDGNPGTDGVFYRFPDRPWWHYQMPALADIDSDGSDEIIIGTQDSTLYALNGDGSDVPGWPVPLADFAGGGVAVGDLDDDGDLEIVATVKNYSRLEAYSHTGTQLWSRFAHMTLFFNPSPSLGDLTGDGKLEVVYPSSNGRLEVRRFDGQLVPGFPINYSTTSYTESSPVLADVSGDGLPDIIIGDETKLIQAFDNGGNLVSGFPLAGQAAFRGTPTASDLDGDGDIEILAVSYDRTVYAWDFDRPYASEACPWPEFKANSHHNSRHGFVVPTTVERREDAPVPSAGLDQNIPNPFNPVTTIVYYVPEGAPRNASLVVYDVTGARVKTLADGVIPPGRHEVRWNGTNERGNRVGTGVYFYRLQMPGFTDTKKMVLLK